MFFLLKVQGERRLALCFQIHKQELQAIQACSIAGSQPRHGSGRQRPGCCLPLATPREAGASQQDNSCPPEFGL